MGDVFHNKYLKNGMRNSVRQVISRWFRENFPIFHPWCVNRSIEHQLSHVQFRECIARSDHSVDGTPAIKHEIVFVFSDN